MKPAGTSGFHGCDSSLRNNLILFPIRSLFPRHFVPKYWLHCMIIYYYTIIPIIPIIANYISLAARLFKRSPGNILSALPSAPLIRRHLPHHSWHLSKWAVKIDRDFDDTNCKYMCLLAASLNPFKILLADLWGNVLPSGPLNVHLAACWEKMSFPPGSVFCPLICRKKKIIHTPQSHLSKRQ